MKPTIPVTFERDLDLEAEAIRASNDILESGTRTVTAGQTASALARRLWERLSPEERIGTRRL